MPPPVTATVAATAPSADHRALLPCLTGALDALDAGWRESVAAPREDPVPDVALVVRRAEWFAACVLVQVLRALAPLHGSGQAHTAVRCSHISVRCLELAPPPAVEGEPARRGTELPWPYDVALCGPGIKGSPVNLVAGNTAEAARRDLVALSVVLADMLREAVGSDSPAAASSIVRDRKGGVVLLAQPQAPWSLACRSFAKQCASPHTVDSDSHETVAAALLRHPFLRDPAVALDAAVATFSAERERGVSFGATASGALFDHHRVLMRLHRREWPPGLPRHATEPPTGSDADSAASDGAPHEAADTFAVPVAATTFLPAVHDLIAELECGAVAPSSAGLGDAAAPALGEAQDAARRARAVAALHNLCDELMQADVEAPEFCQRWLGSMADSLRGYGGIGAPSSAVRSAPAVGVGVTQAQVGHTVTFARELAGFLAPDVHHFDPSAPGTAVDSCSMPDPMSARLGTAHAAAPSRAVEMNNYVYAKWAAVSHSPELRRLLEEVAPDDGTATAPLGTVPPIVSAAATDVPGHRTHEV